LRLIRAHGVDETKVAAAPTEAATDTNGEA
jgi:hypothetical protein